MRSMITNPDRILGVLSYTYLAGSRQVVENILHRHSLPVALNKIATGEGTHFVMPFVPFDECQLFVGSRVPPDQKWISSLRAQFRSRADNVIVNVSPSSSCIDVYPAWATLLAQGTDNGLQEYPLDLFADSYYHLNGAGAKRYSEAVAKEIMENTESSTTAALQAVSDWREQSTAQR